MARCLARSSRSSSRRLPADSERELERDLERDLECDLERDLERDFLSAVACGKTLEAQVGFSLHFSPLADGAFAKQDTHKSGCAFLGTIGSPTRQTFEIHLAARAPTFGRRAETFRVVTKRRFFVHYFSAPLSNGCSSETRTWKLNGSASLPHQPWEIPS